MYVPWPFDLGNHDHVELVADVLDDLLEVIKHPGRVQRVDPHPYSGVTEIMTGQQLDEARARRILGIDWNGVLEVAAHHIALPRGFGRLGANLIDVRRKEMDHSFRPYRQFTQRLWRTNGERLIEIEG